jgi:hypothetical protein
MEMDTIQSWTPLFSTIVTSTLWEESKEVRLLFVTMLALKNRDGLVLSTMSGLKRLANLTIEECEKAIKVLEAPDKKSEITQEFDGRRVERREGGWMILNHEKYRDMVQTTKRRAYQANWQKGYRDRVKKSKDDGYKDGATTAVAEGLKEDEKVADMKKQSHKFTPKPIESWDQREQEENQEQVTAQYPQPDVPAVPPLSTFKKVNLNPISPSQKHPAAAPPSTNAGPPPGLIPEIR